MFHDVEQNTEEWFQLRSGKLTSSSLGKVMANFGKAFGEPAKQLAVQIAVEQITGVPVSSDYTNEHMERGHEEEVIARNLYEQENFVKVSNGGFFDLGFTGASPDGLVGTDGVIEIKSAIPHIHYARVKRGSVDPAYKWQCVANLFGCDREWMDFISYCRLFPEDGQLYVLRMYPEHYQEDYTKLLERISQFERLVDDTKKTILTSEYTVRSAA